MRSTAKARWLLFSALVIALAVSLITPTPGALTEKTIEVYTGVNIYIDDVKLNPTDAKGNPVETFVYNGSTYLPVRAIGEAVGRNVRWDGKTNSVYLTGKTSTSRSKKKSPASAATLTPKFIEVYTGANIYIDNVKLKPKDANGNSVEVFVYNGTTYLPVRAIGEALGKAVQWEGAVNSVYLGKHEGGVSVPSTPAPISEPELTPASVDVTRGYWETNSFRLSDGLTYQFKDDGTYESWYLNGAFSPSGLYTYKDWILILRDNAGQETDRLYYALETGQFVSIKTTHVVEVGYIDNKGNQVPFQEEPTTLTCREEPSAPNPYEGIAPSTVSIDISDPAMYRKLNMFLSYFSEVNLSIYPFDPSHYPHVEDVAFCHAYLRNRSLTEHSDLYIDDYNVRMSEENIKMVVKQLFDGSVDLSSLYQSSCYINGYYYSLITNDMFGYGFTLVDSIADLGRDHFEVQFHTYNGLYSDFPAYDYSDSTVYSTHPDNLPEPYPGQQFVSSPGSAIIKAYQEVDGALSFRLCEYHLD